MNLKKIITLILITITLVSCSFIIGLDKKFNSETLKIDKEHFSIVFSHSIMGETHPCGCRHFPLGGLPQVAGLFNELKQKKDFLYVDIGDTLFPSTVVPSHIKKSLTYGAMNLAKGLDKLGLQYMVPGDFDLALGWSFLQKIKKNVSFEFLISNLKHKETIEHKKHIIAKFGEKTVYIIGLIDPTIMNNYAQDFIPIKVALPSILKDLKAQGYDPKNKNNILVALSHSGIDEDEKIAKQFPNIDWIIGSHTQSFTNFPLEEGKTQIVQVLSKNHYIGEVQFASKGAIKEPWKYHEMREEQAAKLKDNSFIKFIDLHKKEMEKIRDSEQVSFAKFSDPNEKLKTSQSCLECHQEQGNHWKNTPHSISFATLINAGEMNNTSCIGCHSLGLNHKNGFVNLKDIVHFEEKNTNTKAYWNEVKLAFKDIGSIRKLSKNKIKNLSQKWHGIDSKYKVTHNFSNVQCLNCHDKHPEHPFSVGEGEKKTDMKSKCITCHTPEQSPEWYKKDARGIANKLDNEKVKAMIQKIQCSK